MGNSGKALVECLTAGSDLEYTLVNECEVASGWVFTAHSNVLNGGYIRLVIESNNDESLNVNISIVDLESSEVYSERRLEADESSLNDLFNSMEYVLEIFEEELLEREGR